MTKQTKNQTCTACGVTSNAVVKGRCRSFDSCFRRWVEQQKAIGLVPAGTK